MRWDRRLLAGIGLAAAGCDGVSLPAPTASPGVEVACPAEVPGAADGAIAQPDPAATVPSTRPADLRALDPAGASSSPLALARLGSSLVAVLADADERRLALVDLPAGRELAHAALPGTPAHVIVDGHGRLYVTIRDAAMVVGLEARCVADQEPCTPVFVERTRFSTPAEPIALGLTDDDATVLVACGWGHTLHGHPARPGGRELSIPLAREPRGFAVHDGHAFLAHALGSRVSVVSLEHGEVVRERALHWRDDLALDGLSIANLPRFAVQGHAVVATAQRVLVPMVLAYPGEPGAEAEGYGMSIDGFDPFFPHEPVIVALDHGGERAELHLRDEALGADEARAREQRRAWPSARPPCLLPQAAAVDVARDRMLVACRDRGQVLAYAMAESTLEAAEVRRWSVGAGTDAIAVDPSGRHAWAWSPFDRRLDRLALDGDATDPEQTITLPATTAVEHADGRRLFHAPLAFDGRSCASCHVDGRDDGLSWRSPRGMVQTPVLAGRTDGTAPFGWHGEKPTIAAHMRRTFARLRAGDPDEPTLVALEGWIATMPDFHPRPAALTAAQTRGRDLFRSATTGCASCHDDDVGTDGATHRLGRGRAIDTPSLRFVGDTAPYMHDGRHETLREVLVHTDGAMGTTVDLDEGQIADLLAYLRVL